MIIGRHGVSGVTSITPEERAIVLVARSREGSRMSPGSLAVSVGGWKKSSRALDGYIDTLRFTAV